MRCLSTINFLLDLHNSYHPIGYFYTNLLRQSNSNIKIIRVQKKEFTKVTNIKVKLKIIDLLQ